VYIRLSDQQNSAPQPVDAGHLVTIRKGADMSVTVVAVGPMLDAVGEAVSELDATVLYASTLRPFDASGLRAALSGTDIVLVEPSLEGTSSAAISAAVSDRPHRLLSIGVPNVEHRKYGSAARHNQAHGLDAAGLRSRIVDWLATSRTL
jgi:transketolase